jgi:hypothetical protein
MNLLTLRRLQIQRPREAAMTRRRYIWLIACIFLGVSLLDAGFAAAGDVSDIKVTLSYSVGTK